MVGVCRGKKSESGYGCVWIEGGGQCWICGGRPKRADGEEAIRATEAVWGEAVLYGPLACLSGYTACGGA